MRIGSLFSGYGGLDMAVTKINGGQVVWHSDIEPASVRVLSHHWPDVPNLGVVPQQAEFAIRGLLADVAQAVAA